MALADPQTVTINAVATPLARVGQGMSEGQFKDASGEYSFTVSHSANSRYRHSVQLRWDDIVSNPLVPSQNMAVFASAGFTINAPKNGLSNTEVGYIANALSAWLTPANVAKLITGES